MQIFSISKHVGISYCICLCLLGIQTFYEADFSVYKYHSDKFSIALECGQNVKNLISTKDEQRSAFLLSDSEFTLEIFLLYFLNIVLLTPPLAKTLKVSIKSGCVSCVRGLVRSLSHYCLNIQKDNIACRGAQNKHLPRTEKKRNETDKSRVPAMVKTDSMSPIDLCLLWKRVKNNLHVYMPLCKLLLKSVCVFANGSDEKAEEGRTVVGCLHSVCHGFISD